MDPEAPGRPSGTATQPQPLLLVELREDATAVAGIAVLHYAASAVIRPPSELGRVVATTLIESGDVVPRVIGGGAAKTQRR